MTTPKRSNTGTAMQRSPLPALRYLRHTPARAPGPERV